MESVFDIYSKNNYNICKVNLSFDGGVIKYEK